MKKILAIAVALVMALSLAVSVSAETIYEFKTPTSVAFGWTNLIDAGSEEAKAFFEAIGTEGAVIEMIASGVKEGDRNAEPIDAWFQICTQDTVGWSEAGGLKTEGIGETYGFTDEGYVITIPAAAFNDMVKNCGVDVNNLTVILNAGGEWDVASAPIIIRVSTGDAAAAADDAAADETVEAPADDAAAEEAPAADEAPVADDAPATAPSTGIALAVIPAVIAMAAVAVSKKH